MNAAPRHWAAINEVSFVAGMRLLFWVFRVAGRWPFRVLLYPVLGWYLLAMPRARRVSAAYLKRVAAYAPVPRLGVLRHFAAFAESILDKMLLWGGLFDTSRVKLVGVEAVNAMLARGQGGLLVCSHFGNLELCRVLSLQRPDVKLTVLVHTRHAQAFNRMLGRLNPASQLNMMQVTDMSAATAMLLAERVGRGELVVIAGDRVPVSGQPRVTAAEFLGAPAPFPIGPYVLAGVLQCPVYMLFTLQRGDQAELHFELLRESLRLPRKDRDAALAAVAAEYAARLQHFCMQAPLQWFNFYDFWQFPELEQNDAPG
ncbi:acyltransferase [Massilia sp. MB5]|uniref:LpxL/LpxP family acyltransferase n=1 Tax=Massilia sp. MB5 TaxID=2919578 RepID=UPI001F0E47EC|nr:acyltransferase [Massilia sp. MB5]UMR30534.1 acyltransferase [Massilia sp. MB5]